MQLGTRLALLVWVIGLAACTNDGDVSSGRYEVHDIGVFELDGNAVEGAGAALDWETVKDQDPAVTPNLIASTGIVPDPDNAGTATVLATGGSKDNNLIEDWVHRPSGNPSPQDKDQIVNAFAAAYDVGGELVIYFGADRFSNDGAAQLGFWFFQDEIVAQSDGSFSGEHVVGDLLVQMNVVQGGTVPIIQVFEWVGSGGSHGALDELIAAADAPCSTAAADDDVCAETNSDFTPAPWDYTPKDDGGHPGDFPPRSFFEGGINITDVFAAAGQDVPCFATFMAETRSSHPFDSTLRDFVLHAFPVCSISISKDCTAGAIDSSGTGFVYTYDGTVTNSGFGTLYDVTVVDQGTTFNLGTLAPGASASFGPATFSSSENPATNEATVTAATTSGGTATITDMASDVCPAVEVFPRLSTTKTCTPTLVELDGNIVVAVEFSGQVCNDSVPAFDLENVVVTNDNGTPGDTADDVTVGTFPTLSPGCTTYGTHTYYPSTLDSVDPFDFSDRVSASGTAPAALGGATAVWDTTSGAASCNLCPAPAAE